MPRRRRRLTAPLRPWDALEPRCLLAAPVILGNSGEIASSQFQPFGFKTLVGVQARDVKTRGPIKINLVNTASSSGAASQSATSAPVNTGLIAGSQFNGGGFLTVGLQFNHVFLGGGLTVSGFDNEHPGIPAALAVAPDAASAQPHLPTSGTSNLVENSQFNDGGFGILDRTSTGTIIGREGRVGFQWRKVRVRGPVNVGLDDVIIQPGAVTSLAASASTIANAAPAASPQGSTVIDLITNSGQIRGSQFNDGGFGDIGFQWSNVGIGGHVATSTNTLFIKPQQDGYGPITIANEVYGETSTGAAKTTGANTLTDDAVVQSNSAGAPAAVPSAPVQTTYTNSATNSGQLVGAQFNDGGFGDVGLQWKRVAVKGNVTAVHNSLTVQPENQGQGFITVQGIQFPTTPTVEPRPSGERVHRVPAYPAVIAHDGNSVKGKLPKPTGPLSPSFPTPFNDGHTVTLPYPGNYPLVNSATNSGLVKGGQFNAGGFGDQGLQWQKVRVGGNVQIVHNSLSVHPEGSGLAGISVSNVNYGPPVSKRVARNLKVLPYAVISAGTTGTVSVSGSAASSTQSKGQRRFLPPPNDRWLINQQVASPNGTNVFLQWNGIEHHRGLVLVHNVILLKGVGPMTGPITLSNIRFPFRVPPIPPLTVVTSRPPATASAQSQVATKTGTHRRRAASPSDEPRDANLLNSANNSGIISHAQFSDGGFGDIGLQWRNVTVSGSVDVVHNTLAVDESSDLPAGDKPGPITISNITFNSDALKSGVSRAHNQFVLSPPNVVRRASTHGVNLGRALPGNRAVRDESTNSGILAGGQLSAGGANHALLQWQCVKVDGKVTVVDNVLSISVMNRPSSPITISNVTFA